MSLVAKSGEEFGDIIFREEMLADIERRRHSSESVILV